jgi:hypothetical protein
MQTSQVKQALANGPVYDTTPLFTLLPTSQLADLKHKLYHNSLKTSITKATLTAKHQQTYFLP